jgi:hypothetical protein
MRRFMNECDVAIDLSSGERTLSKATLENSPHAFTQKLRSQHLFDFFLHKAIGGGGGGAFSATLGHKGLFVRQHSLFVINFIFANAAGRRRAYDFRKL